MVTLLYFARTNKQRFRVIVLTEFASRALTIFVLYCISMRRFLQLAEPAVGTKYDYKCRKNNRAFGI